jgi:hypothetical protein
MPTKPWFTANELLFWIADQEAPDGQSPRGILRRIAEQRAIEDAASAAIKNELDASLYRENLAKLDESEENVWSALRNALIESLANGAVIAFGLTSPDGDLNPIRFQHWAFLELDWDRGIAKGHGLAYFGLRFVPTARLNEVRDVLPERWRNLGLPKPPKPKAEPEPRPEREPQPVYRTGGAGRPSSRHLIEAELNRRAEAGTTRPTLRLEAASLVAWLRKAHPEAAPATQKTIENLIRGTYRKLRPGP